MSICAETTRNSRNRTRLHPLTIHGCDVVDLLMLSTAVYSLRTVALAVIETSLLERLGIKNMIFYACDAVCAWIIAMFAAHQLS